jgi:hypothetical protein
MLPVSKYKKGQAFLLVLMGTPGRSTPLRLNGTETAEKFRLPGFVRRENRAQGAPKPVGNEGTYY